MAKKTQAQLADRHLLYQLSVQVPEAEVSFLNRTFKKRYGRPPLSLREDFCGTAYLCCTWVNSRKDRKAFGVDLDGEVLDWGREHNVEAIGRRKDRVELELGDVRQQRAPKVDVQVAFNFSYCCFHTRAELLEYFRAVRASVADEGQFVLDIHGGAESLDEMVEKKKIEDPPKGFEGAKYLWKQKEFDPLNHLTKRAIGFAFKDGSEIKKAFSYDWRIWTAPELRDALIEAGFSEVEFYWEGTDRETGEGNGEYRKVRKGENDPAWITYIVAIP